MNDTSPSEATAMRSLPELIEARMLNGDAFTYGGLCITFGAEHDRLIDKTIQRLRRKNLIAFKREGRNTIWRVVEQTS